MVFLVHIYKSNFQFFDRERGDRVCPARARSPIPDSSHHHSLFMKFVQLTIDGAELEMKCHLMVQFGIKEPPGGIIWY